VHYLQTKAAPVKGNCNIESPAIPDVDQGQLAIVPPPVHVAKPPFTRAGAYLSRRFCIHPEIADLVAALAGIGADRRAA
jgi:hypothetical protein